MAKANVFQLLVRELAGGEVGNGGTAFDGEDDGAYRALASPEALGAGAHDALAELAYLAVGSDGSIGEEEERLLRDWFTLLDGSPASYGKRFDTYADRKAADGRSGRLSAIAALLSTSSSRRLGYALVFALTSSDLARSPKEERFEADVAIALGLDEVQVGELELLVMSKLSVA